MRLQLALNVRNLQQAIDFYSKMFGAQVHKRRPGYANFTLSEPPLKLVLFERPGTQERINHLGVEVFDDADVTNAIERLGAAGLSHEVELKTHCCHAIQNKVWATGPEGLRWEWYRIIDDKNAIAPAPRPLTEEDKRKTCCPSGGQTRTGT